MQRVRLARSAALEANQGTFEWEAQGADAYTTYTMQQRVLLAGGVTRWQRSTGPRTYTIWGNRSRRSMWRVDNMELVTPDPEESRDSL